jgi:hypothetical protein
VPKPRTEVLSDKSEPVSVSPGPTQVSGRKKAALGESGGTGLLEVVAVYDVALCRKVVVGRGVDGCELLQQTGPAPVSFLCFESDTRHQGDRIWQRSTATSSSGVRFALR